MTALANWAWTETRDRANRLAYASERIFMVLIFQFARANNKRGPVDGGKTSAGPEDFWK